jgi:hypothetical protein
MLLTLRVGHLRSRLVSSDASDLQSDADPRLVSINSKPFRNPWMSLWDRQGHLPVALRELPGVAGALRRPRAGCARDELVI